MTVAIATKHLLLNSTHRLKNHVQPVSTQGIPFFSACTVFSSRELVCFWWMCLCWSCEDFFSPISFTFLWNSRYCKNKIAWSGCRLKKLMNNSFFVYFWTYIRVWLSNLFVQIWACTFAVLLLLILQCFALETSLSGGTVLFLEAVSLKITISVGN